MFSFGQPLTWMKTNVTEAKHTSGNMSLAFQLRINMLKDKCNTLPLKYWTPLLWSQRPTWNDWYFILYQTATFHSHSPVFWCDSRSQRKHTAYVLLLDNWQTCEWMKWLAYFSTRPKNIHEFIFKKMKVCLFLLDCISSYLCLFSHICSFYISQCNCIFITATFLHQTIWLYISQCPFISCNCKFMLSASKDWGQ